MGAKTIGIYSPSGAFSDAVEKTELFRKGRKRLENNGLKTQESRRCASTWWHASATPKDRALDLVELVEDQEVDIIIPSIGGHVAHQLLPYLDFERIAGSGKALFGFSDNAIIPLVTAAQTGSITFHTLCDVTFGFGRCDGENYVLTEASFMAAIQTGTFDLAGSRAWKPLQGGNASGVLLGGNLKGLTMLAGTPWWPDWKGKILFWESADPKHAVIQHLVHLANMGVFEEIAGMIIGRFSTLKESFYKPNQVMPLEVLLLDILGLRGRFPIVIEADIGHDVENVTIPLGAIADINVSESVECKICI
jgi:muramoyltetrapeptide carboxypeptidase